MINFSNGVGVKGAQRMNHSLAKVTRRLFFLFASFFLVGCTSISSSGGIVPEASSSGETIPGRTAIDRLMNSYVFYGNDAQGLAYYKSDTVNASGTYDTCVAVGTCTNATITIPSTFDGNPVVGVKEDGFSLDETLTAVTFPSSTSFTMIGSQAFNGTGLKSVTIPAYVSAINPSSFLDCRALTGVYFAAPTDGVSAVSSIGDYAFADCPYLIHFRFPGNLTTIGASAFQGDSSLVRAILPSGVTTLGPSAFMDCYSIGLVYFPSSVTTVGAYAFRGCLKAQAYFNNASVPSGFAENWDYAGPSYVTPSTAPSKTAPNLYKVFNKTNLNIVNPFIYVKTNVNEADPNYNITIIAYVGSENTAANKSVSLDIPDTLPDPDYLQDDGTSTYNHPIVAIDTQAFQYHTEIGSVTFGKYLESIADLAFNGCDYLQSLDFSGALRLKSIGTQAFYRAKVSSGNGVATLAFPASLESVGSEAFAGFNHVTSLSFAASGTTYTKATTSPYAWTASTISSQLTTIGYRAFRYLGNAVITASNLSTNDLVLPCNKLTGIDANAFEQAYALRSVTFQEGSGVSVSVGNNAFFNAMYLRSLTLSSHVTSLGSNCFAQNKMGPTQDGYFLHSVYLPANLTSIGSTCFSGQYRLTLYTPALEGSLPGGYSSTFRDVDLKTGLSTSDYSEKGVAPLFYNVGDGIGQCHLIRYDLSGYGKFDFLTAADSTGALTASTASLTRYYYDGTASTTLTPKCPSSINGTYNSINVTYTIKAVEKNAFYYSSTGKKASSLQSITLPTAISSLGGISFMNCSFLASVSSYGTNGTTSANKLPSSLSTISSFAFANDTLLTTLIIPPGLTAIGTSPWQGCSALASLTMDGTETGTTYSCTSNAIYLGTAFQELILLAPGANFGVLTLPTTVTTIDAYAARNATKLTGIIAPSTLTSIGSYAFQGCTAFASFRFAANGTSNLTIADNAFNGQTSLTTFEFPSNLTSIGANAFNGDAALSKCPTSSSQNTFTSGALNLSGCSNLSSIGSSAFNACTGLTTLTLPNAYKTIRSSTFAACTGLTSVTLGNAVTSIGASSFSGDTALTSINLPSTLTSIGTSAFSGDVVLNNVVIPTSLTSIGTSAFDADVGLTSLTFGTGAVGDIVGRSGTLTIGDYAFRGCTNTSLASIVLPSNVSFSFSGSGTPSTSSAFPFSGCNSTLKLFLGDTYNDYVGNTANYPAGWNYRAYAATGSALPTYLYSADSPTTSSEYSYWRYVNGTPTPWPAS